MAYDIPIGADGFDKLSDAIDKTISKVDVLDQRVKGLKADAGSVTIGGRQMSTAGVGASGPSMRVYDVPRGPNQRLAEATHRLTQMRATGDASLIRDAEGKVDTARRAVERQERSLTEANDPVLAALMSSRIGPGGRLYPLVNKLQAAGLTSSEALEGMGMSSQNAAQLAPLMAQVVKMAIPAAIGAAVVAGGIKLAEGASASIGRRAGLRDIAGGGAGSIGRALALGASPGQVMGFGDDLRNGSSASAYFASKGVRDLGVYTDDKTGNFLKGIDALRNARLSPEQRRRYLRETPSLQDKAWMTDPSLLPEANYRQLRDSFGGDMSESELSDRVRQRNIHEAMKMKWQNRFNSWQEDAGSRAMGTMDRLAGEQGWAGFVGGVVDQMPIFGAVKDVIDRLTAGSRRGKGGGAKVASGGQPATQYDADGNAYTSMGDGPYMSGGGARSRSGIPPGYASQRLSENFESQAINMGAFGMN